MVTPIVLNTAEYIAQNKIEYEYIENEMHEIHGGYVPIPQKPAKSDSNKLPASIPKCIKGITDKEVSLILFRFCS